MGKKAKFKIRKTKYPVELVVVAGDGDLFFGYRNGVDALDGTGNDDSLQVAVYELVSVKKIAKSAAIVADDVEEDD